MKTLSITHKIIPDDDVYRIVAVADIRDGVSQRTISRRVASAPVYANALALLSSYPDLTYRMIPLDRPPYVGESYYMVSYSLDNPVGGGEGDLYIRIEMYTRHHGSWDHTELMATGLDSGYCLDEALERLGVSDVTSYRLALT